MKKSFAKLLALSVVCIMAFSLFAACGNKDEGGEGGKDSVIIATANEPPTMAPHQHSAVAGGYMNILTHNTLFKTDIETLEPVPCLVESYELLSDKEWQLNLRKGVKFHNGEEMKAADVIASMEYARSFPSFTSTYTEFWDKVEAKDDYTLVVTTKEIYAKTLRDLGSHYVLPKSLIESGHDFNAEPVGTGPYKFVNWKLGDQIEFEAFEDYWEGAPAIKHLTYRIIPEGSSRTIALEAGEIDFIVEVDNNDLGRLEEDEGITVINKTGTSFNFMVLNNEKHPFDNKDFRHAMNCAIDKDALVEVALNGAGTGNFTQTPIVFEGKATNIPDRYDLDLARDYLQKSGIDPTTVSFSCICSDDVKRRCGEVIQANLQELGITMTLESMDLATYLSAAADGSLDACIGGYTTTNMMSFIEGKMTSKQIGGSNWQRTNDPYIDSAYEDAVKTLDDDARNAKLTEIANYINDLCPQVPTYGQNITRAYNSKLQNIDVSATNTLYWQYVSWAE